MWKIAIDVMGGDNAPQAVLDGCAQFLEMQEFSDTKLLLFGDLSCMESYWSTHPYDKERVELFPTTEVIGFNEHPTAAVRSKKDSSLVRAVTAVKDGLADCVVSAGSTGALLTAATLIIRRQKGVKRPCMASVLPTVKGSGVMIVDCGANTDCKPGYLQQFALMGKAYMQLVEGVKEPKIGLLNNGTEEEKGNLLTKEVYQRLSAMDDISFAGNAEARDVMAGSFDIIVCDGFDGNVLLKSTEGAASAITKMLKQELYSSLRNKLGGLLAKPAFRSLKKKMDYSEYGGAPLLGVNGGVIKAHGSSDANAMKNAIRQAYRLAEGRVVQKVGDEIAKINIED